ncbi:MAG: lysozyme inhibitor LprI family protein [Nitrospirota bacterium]
MREILGAMLLSLFLQNIVYAQVKDPCANAMTQLEMNRCAGDEFKSANHKLESAYNALLERLDANHKTQVQDAQSTWMIFRDRQCEAETYLSRGGSMHQMELALCKKTITQSRIDQLNNLRKSLEK